MEPQEETLQEKFDQFDSEVRKLRQKPQGLARELLDLQAKLERLRTARFSQLALEETEKAATLAKEIDKLAEEVEIVEAKAAAFGSGGSQSAMALVQNAPDSELYNLALSIVAEASELAPSLEKELQHFVNWGFEEEKQKYIAKIEDFSEKLAELWQINFAGLTCQKYLPEDLRSVTRVRLIAPMQSLFSIEIDEVAEAYRPLSRTTLPD